MRKLIGFLAPLILGILSAIVVESPSFAIPIVYIATVNASGSLGGVPFTNANLVISMQADTTNVADFSGPPCCAGSAFENEGTGRLTVGTGAPVTFIGAVGVFDNQYEAAGGFASFITYPDIVNLENDALTTYDLTTSIGPITSIVPFSNDGMGGIIEPGGGFPTTGGVLLLTSAGPVTFTAATCASVFNNQSVVFSGVGTPTATINFAPSAAIPGLTLKEAESDCNVQAFAWVQTVTVGALSSLASFACDDPLCTTQTQVLQGTTIDDPPPFGWRYCNPNYPGNVVAIAGDCSQSSPYYGALPSADEIPTFKDTPTALGETFLTKLVGIVAGGADQTEYSFRWTTTWNGTTAGVQTYFNEGSPDPGSGTGGITLVSINGVPVGVPEPSTFALLAAGLTAFGLVRRRKAA